MIEDKDMKYAVDMLCDNDEFLIIGIKRDNVNHEHAFSHFVSDLLLMPAFLDYLQVQRSKIYYSGGETDER